MQQIKGNLLFSKRKLVLERYGEKALADILSNARQDTRTLFMGIIDTKAWYDNEFYADFQRAFDKTFGRDEFIRMSACTMEHQLQKYYGWVFRFVTLEMVPPRANEFWRKMHPSGELKCEINRPEVSFSVKGFSLDDIQAIGLMYYIKGFIEHVEKKRHICSFRRSGKMDITFTFLAEH